MRRTLAAALNTFAKLELSHIVELKTTRHDRAGQGRDRGLALAAGSNGERAMYPPAPCVPGRSMDPGEADARLISMSRSTSADLVIQPWPGCTRE